MTQPVPAAARSLERLEAERKSLSSQLVSLDAYDRWGARTDEDRERAYAEADAAQKAKAEATTKLKALVGQLRTEDPAAIEAWAAAHVTLLEHYIGTLEGSNDRSTERYVAHEEIEAWKAFAAGGEELVRQNTSYVTFDQALYEALFPPE